MIFPPFDDPFGKKKLGERPPIKVPADLNWDAIEAKIKARKQPINTGEPKYDSSGYLARMREEDPWPTQDDKNTPKVSLSNCQFKTPSEDLMVVEPCTVACDVKILQPPSVRRIVFRLQSRLTDSDPWDDVNGSAEGYLKIALPDQTVQAKLSLCSPETSPELGSTIHYRVTAEHAEATSNVESPEASVVFRSSSQRVAFPSALYAPDALVPQFAGDSDLFQRLHTILDLGRQNPNYDVDALGHSGSGDTAADPGALAHSRAQILACLVTRDPSALGKQLADQGSVVDLQQVLHGLNDRGWTCDPGPVDGADGPKTQAGVQAFQQDHNERGLEPLDHDGVAGPLTWAALAQAWVDLVFTLDAPPEPDADDSSASDTSESEAPADPAQSSGSPALQPLTKLRVLSCADLYPPDSGDGHRGVEIHFYPPKIRPDLEET